MNFRQIFLGLLLSLLLLGCQKEAEKAALDYPKHPELPKLQPFKTKIKTIDSSKIDFLNDYFRVFWEANKLEGGILVAQNGRILFEKYLGYLDRNDSLAINQGTALHLASVSKFITATAIMMMVNNGTLALDMEVNRILPDFPYDKIRLIDLLNHRSGLPNYAYFTEPAEVWNHQKTLKNSDVLNLMHKFRFPLLFEPDSHFQYCNTNYVILALILEKVSDRPFDMALDEMIFKPLKMNNTFVFDMAKDSARIHKSYSYSHRTFNWDYLDDIYGDKNIYSTPRDLLKLDQALYAKWARKSLIDSIYKGYSYERKGIRNYGLGVRMFEWEDGKHLFFHNGWWHGNNTSFIRMIDEGVTIIALGNRKNRAYYSTLNLASLFGDYPIDLAQSEETKRALLRQDSIRKDSIRRDSILKDSIIRLEDKNERLIPAP